MARPWTAKHGGIYLSQPSLPVARMIVSIDGWTPFGIEQIGTKPKQWFEEPGSGRRWLYKALTPNPKRGGGFYMRGDDWAEVVSSDIARWLGLPTARVELAEQGGQPGVISRSVAAGSALIHGNEVLDGRDPTYSTHTERINPMYSVKAVMEVMREIDGPPDTYLDADEAFAGYLILDAIVGNTDRHHQNWAVLRTNSVRPRLSPTFDHASSLGSILDDDERAERLSATMPGRTVEAYARRAHTPFADAQSPLAAASIALAILLPSQRLRWRDLVRDAGNQVEDVLSRVPVSRMSEPSRRFAESLVHHNITMLLETQGRLT